MRGASNIRRTVRPGGAQSVVLASTATSTASLALAATAIFPPDASNAVSTAAGTLTAKTLIPTNASGAISAASGAFTAITLAATSASNATSTTSGAITLPPLGGLSASASTGSLLLTTITLLPLATSGAISSGVATVSAGEPLPGIASNAVSAGSNLPLSAPSLLTLRAAGASRAAMHATTVGWISGLSTSASSGRLTLYVYQSPIAIIVVSGANSDILVVGARIETPWPLPFPFPDPVPWPFPRSRSNPTVTDVPVVTT